MNMEEYIEHLQRMSENKPSVETRKVKQLRIVSKKKLEPKQFKANKR